MKVKLIKVRNNIEGLSPGTLIIFSQSESAHYSIRKFLSTLLKFL